MLCQRAGRHTERSYQRPQTLREFPAKPTIRIHALGNAPRSVCHPPHQRRRCPPPPRPWIPAAPRWRLADVEALIGASLTATARSPTLPPSRPRPATGDRPVPPASYAMAPAASVSAILLAHPDSRSFGVGRVLRDQVCALPPRPSGAPNPFHAQSLRPRGRPSVCFQERKPTDGWNSYFPEEPLATRSGSSGVCVHFAPKIYPPP